MSIMEDFIRAQNVKENSIRCGKVEEARATGERYQMITYEDKESILKSLDTFYKLYGLIASNALEVQANVVLVKDMFKKSVKEVEE